MKETIIRYIKSSSITFLMGFAAAMYSEFDAFTLQSFTDGTILGLFFVALRGGIKALLEYALVAYQNYNK